MTDRTDTLPSGRPPAQFHPLRDYVAIELQLPTQPPLLDRMLNRIEEGQRR